MLRKITLIVAVLIFLIGPLLGRMFFTSYRDLKAARSAQAIGDLDEAIENYQSVLLWAWPGSKTFDSAFNEAVRMIEVARLSPELELKAWNEIRRALYSSRNFLTAQEARILALQEIDSRIKKISAADGPFDLKQSAVQLPHYGLSALASWSFLCWILSVFVLIWKGFNPDGSIKNKRARQFGAVALVAYCIWVVALVFA